MYFVKVYLNIFSEVIYLLGVDLVKEYKFFVEVSLYLFDKDNWKSIWVVCVFVLFYLYRKSVILGYFYVGK